MDMKFIHVLWLLTNAKKSTDRKAPLSPWEGGFFNFKDLRGGFKERGLLERGLIRQRHLFILSN